MPFHDDDDQDCQSPSAISHGDKIKAFNFDRVETQKERMKVTFDSKLKKFQFGNMVEKKDSETMREAKFRKEMFNKTAEKWRERMKVKNDDFKKKAVNLI